MSHLRTLIECSLRDLVEAELGPAGWDSLLRDTVVEEINDPDHTYEIGHLRGLSKLAAQRLRRERSVLLLELGSRWWSTHKPSCPASSTNRERAHGLLEQVRNDEDLSLAGISVAPHIGLYPAYGFILHHTMPIKGCRAFVIGALYGAGKGHRLHIDVRLLEPYELNGQMDVLAVEY